MLHINKCNDAHRARVQEGFLPGSCDDTTTTTTSMRSFKVMLRHACLSANPWYTRYLIHSAELVRVYSIEYVSMLCVRFVVRMRRDA